MISTKAFIPIASHRVFSLHFAGGKKTYLNNVPTIVPKTVKPIERTPRRTLNSTEVTPDDLMKFIESEADSDLTQEAILQKQINDLQKQVNKLNTELSCKNKKLLDTKKVMQKQKLCIDRFKHNTTYLKFYTGFESFEIFKTFLDCLNPVANSLVYYGSNTNIEKIVSNDFVKRGSERTRTVEEEFFLTWVRLSCAFPVQDLSVRFNLSSSSISRILSTWIDFLHSPFRMLPIRASKETVVK